MPGLSLCWPNKPPPNPPPELPEPEPKPPRIRLIIRLRNKSGNEMKRANAAPNPYGNGKIICKPMLTARDANRNIKYDL